MATSKKNDAINLFRQYVSPGKADFYLSAGMDFVLGFRKGCFLHDMDGEKKLFNLHCNGGVFNLGHRNPEIMQTLTEALETLDIGNGHLMSRERAELARMLADRMPGDLSVTVFGVSGGEAVDLALKVARGHTGRSGIVSVSGGYHGHTGLALAAGDPKYRLPFGVALPGFVQVPYNDAAAMEQAVGPDTAAVILESIPATLGMETPAPGYLETVRRICDDKGALLILDEVQTGLARTGKLFCFEHFGVTPDMVVLGKGLSGGLYPITATVMREGLGSMFREDPFLHVSTFGGAELGCRVAKKVLTMSSSPELLAHVNRLSGLFADGIGELCRKHSILNGLNGMGLFLGLVFENDSMGPLFSLAAYQNDLLMVYANNNKQVCQLLPPLVMEESQVSWVMERLDRSLSTLASFLGK
ncbi:MAG: aspartate aminotransferase family protein [Thermodesulfobacteriota bacterium]